MDVEQLLELHDLDTLEEQLVMEEIAEIDQRDLQIIRQRNKRRRRRRWYVRELSEARRHSGLFNAPPAPATHIDDEMYFANFRMSAHRFEDLLDRVTPYVTRKLTHRCPVSVRERLAVTLRILASGCSQQSVAASYKMGASTVKKIVSEVCGAIWAALRSEFVALPTPAQWSDIAKDFWTLWNFPNCIGAIDGKRVQVRALPVGAGSDSSNSHGTRSVVLVALSDAHYRFTMVDVGACGRGGDGGVRQLAIPPPADLPGTTVPVPHVVVGDASFPLHMNLMTPFQGSNLPEVQRIYNCRHSRALRVVENALGIMAARWRIFCQPVKFHPDKTVAAVKACVALHNYLICTDAANTPAARYIPAAFPDATTAGGATQEGEWRRQVEGAGGLMDIQTHKLASRARSSQAATGVREDLVTFFSSPSGQHAVAKCDGES